MLTSCKQAKTEAKSSGTETYGKKPGIPGKKIGILGGTFDPIHRTHLRIAEAARREYGLDQVIFMPAGDPYFKADQQVTPAFVRYEMTLAAVRELNEREKNRESSSEESPGTLPAANTTNAVLPPKCGPDRKSDQKPGQLPVPKEGTEKTPCYVCSDLEIKRAGATRTAETILALKGLYPKDRLYFIMGLDSLEALAGWYRPEIILQNAVILCAVRKAADPAKPSETANGQTHAVLRDNDGTSAGAAVAPAGYIGDTDGEAAIRGSEEDADLIELLFQQDMVRFRTAADYLRAEYADAAPDIRQIHCEITDVSSSMIREKIAKGEPTGDLLLPSVKEYIAKHGLYQQHYTVR